MMQNPIFCIIGERGAGKTLCATALVVSYTEVDKMKAITNYKTFGIKNCENRAFSWIKSHLDEINDTVLVIDEAHVGADAYEFFHSGVKALTDWITQIRKRNVTLFVITQRFETLAKRLREQVNYIIQVTETEVVGQPLVEIFDRGKAVGDDFVRDFILKGRQYFNKYDTNEIITDSTDDEKVKNPTKSPVTKKSSK